MNLRIFTLELLESYLPTHTLSFCKLRSCMAQVPMHMVIGKPIPTPHMDDPSDKDVQLYLNVYITAMERLCEKYKHETGYADMQFQVV